MKLMPIIALSGLTLSTAALAVDTDADGIDDAIDNCTERFNPLQLDTDGDLFGNVCDGDLNNDGTVNLVDYSLLWSERGEAYETGDYDHDGVISETDVNYWAFVLFATPLGPSGCADHPGTCGRTVDLYDPDLDGWNESSRDTCPGFYNADSNRDTDGDGIGDACDLCLNVDDSDSPGIDTDGDGIGNACDADYNNDGFVNSTDWGLFLSCFTASGSSTGTACAEADADGDGFVTSGDFGPFLSQFNAGVPGESGLACADAIAQVPGCPLYGDLYDRLHANSIPRHVSFHGVDLTPEPSCSGETGFCNGPATGGGPYDFAGYSVSFAGDVNHDGYQDILVGALGETYKRKPRTYMVLGSADGFSDMSLADADTEIEGFFDYTGPGSSYGGGGSVAAGAGDLDNDGYSDIMIGAFNSDVGGEGAGAVYVVMGSSSGIPDMDLGQADAIITGEYGGGYFGNNQESAGDVNADGYSDLILLQRGTPKAYLVMGSETGLEDMSVSDADVIMSHPSYINEVSSGGDVNADGYSDVWIGGGYSSANPKGVAYLMLGSSTSAASVDLTTSADTELTSETVGESALLAIADAGDVNGDGYSDVIIGDSRYGSDDVETIYIVHGSSTGISDGSLAFADTRLTAEFTDSWVGHDVFTAGDINNDGFDDVIIGSRQYDTDRTNYVMLGSASGVPDGSLADADLRLTGIVGGTRLDAGVDVDNDGYSELLVGEWGAPGLARLVSGHTLFDLAR